MQKLFTTIILFSLSVTLVAKEIDITKSNGTDQEVITSLLPEPADNTVKRGANIKITFDKKLKKEKIQKSMDLKYLGCKQEKKEKLKQRRDKNLQRCNTRFKNNKNLRKSCKQCVREVFRCQKNRVCKPKNIGGKTKYLQKRDTLKFNPHKRLKPGYYQATAKGLKTTDNKKIKNIKYRFEVSKNTIENITLSQTDINLKEEESTKLTLQATFKDGTLADITQDINWIIGDATLISIDADGNLKALKSGETLVQAEYHGKVSEEVKVTITEKAEVINGYVLPPEPDEALNNSTLLGIDSNDNGVRDDVERYIVKTYKDHHEIVTEIGFQRARAYQQILDNPLNWEENHENITAAIDCNLYFKSRAKYFGESILVDHVIDLRDIQLNIKSRTRAYLTYDRQLSGGVYPFTKAHKMREKCNFDVDALLGGE